MQIHHKGKYSHTTDGKPFAAVDLMNDVKRYVKGAETILFEDAVNVAIDEKEAAHLAEQIIEFARPADGLYLCFEKHVIAANRFEVKIELRRPVASNDLLERAEYAEKRLAAILDTWHTRDYDAFKLLLEAN